MPINVQRGTRHVSRHVSAIVHARVQGSVQLGSRLFEAVMVSSLEQPEEEHNPTRYLCEVMQCKLQVELKQANILY